MSNNAAITDRLYTDIEWALSEGLPQRQVIAMLERLIVQAPPGSLYANYARRQLAELVVSEEPFRAARLAQQVLEGEPDDDRAHAVLGLAHLIMGHFALAEASYRRALALVPRCPWYCHNLGHLLDVGRGRPQEALPLLKISRLALPREPEVASSYAHALLAAGQPEPAWRHLLSAVGGDEQRAEQLFESWQEDLTASRL